MKPNITRAQIAGGIEPVTTQVLLKVAPDFGFHTTIVR